MNYEIATGATTAALSLKVNALCDKGWTPCGGVAIHFGTDRSPEPAYAQAMTSTPESRQAAAKAAAC